MEDHPNQEPNRGSWIMDAQRKDIIAILDNAPCGIVINNTSTDGDVLYINRESFNLMGYTVSEVPTGRVAQKTFLENLEHMKGIYAFQKELKKTGKAVCSGRVVTKSGELKHIEISGVLMPNGNVVSMWTDVTRREIAEVELRESEAKFRTLFEQSSDAVLLLRDDHIIDCNKVAEQLLRTTDRNQIVNSTLDRLSSANQSDGSATTKRARAKFDETVGHKNLHFEWHLKDFDGHTFLAEASVTTIQLQGQNVFYVVLRDISAWKSAEKALLEARNKLEDRVNERTSKLRSVNRRLRREIQRREQVERELERSREELRLLSEHLQRAREDERERIAREVHDELGQLLSALKIDVTCLGNRTPLAANEVLSQTRNMERQIDNAIHSVRHICSELRPPILEDFGLSAAIEWYLEDFQKRTGIQCSADIDPNIPKGKKGLRLMLFRVFQESMTNILRHTGATRVNVQLNIASGLLTLKVKNNGKGITKGEMENPRSFGIIGIRERVRFWGGQSHFKGTPNKGTTMTVTIPLQESDVGL
jgi:PAS domain S-box-containing protein